MHSVVQFQLPGALLSEDDISEFNLILDITGERFLTSADQRYFDENPISILKIDENITSSLTLKKIVFGFEIRLVPLNSLPFQYLLKVFSVIDLLYL